MFHPNRQLLGREQDGIERPSIVVAVAGKREQALRFDPFSVGSHYHIALKASDETYAELKTRLNAAGEKFRETDHGYCKSIYTTSPDGMILEFTCDPPDVAEIDALRRGDAHSELERWLGGDRRVNNQLRHREA
jgi:hypothetical protein